MRGRNRASNAALDLRILDPGGQRRKRLGGIIPRLHVDPPPVDGATVQTRRRAGLEPSQPEADPFQGPRKADRRCLPHAPGGHRLIADVDQPAQKRSGRHNNGFGGKEPTVGEPYTGDRPLAGEHVLGFSGDDGEIGVIADGLLHGRSIESTVRLRPRTAHRWALATIENPKLDPAEVRYPAHQAVQRINFPDQMALSEAPDCRIARHRPDRIETMGDEGRARPHPGGRRSRLAAGVTTTYHNDVVSHELQIRFRSEPIAPLELRSKRTSRRRGSFRPEQCSREPRMTIFFSRGYLGSDVSRETRIRGNGGPERAGP